MDNRLDFFNTLNEHAKTLTEDDAILVLAHNTKDGDCITMLNGNWEILSALLTIDGYVNFENGDDKMFNEIKKGIVQIAFNICMKNEEYKKLMLKKLMQ